MIKVNGRLFWTIFDAGARNTYVVPAVAQLLTTAKAARPIRSVLGGQVKQTDITALLQAEIEGRQISTHALVVDQIGTDEDGRPIDVLFGALAMQQWGIRPLPDEERLDLSHYPDEFVEFMESQTMGRVAVAATIENLHDLENASRGLLPLDDVRRVEVPDALVDTGASMLSMPRRFIEQLGLRPLHTRSVRTSSGPRVAQVYGTVRLTVLSRDCPSDVIEVSDDCPVLIGQVPLELMDLVVDPAGQRLIGNPAHGGEQVIELY
jgi:predicted aspartyl protease